MNQIDCTDLKILQILQDEGRIPVTQLSAQLDIPHATIRDRIRKMETDGVIKGYKAVIDSAKVGLLITAFVQITLDHQLQTSLNDTIDALMHIAEVSEFYVLTGEIDIVARIHAHDIDHLRDIVFERLKTIPGFARSNTRVVMTLGAKSITLPDQI